MKQSNGQTYAYDTQLTLGEKYERQLDDYLGQYFEISDVDRNLQRLGIDRIFYQPRHDKAYLVEYKTDTLARGTNNIYVETISVSTNTQTKLGWVYTSQADKIIYWTLPDTIYIFEPKTIEKQIGEWMKKFRQVKVKNESYYGEGILVPISEFKQHCKVKTINVH